MRQGDQEGGEGNVTVPAPSEHWLSASAAALYEAGHDPAAWPAALDQIRQLFHGSSACFGLEDLRTRIGTAISIGTDPAFHASYRDHYARHNNLWQPHDLSAPGTVFSDRSLMPKQAFHNSVFFNEWLRPQDGYASLGCKVWSQGHLAGFVNIQRGRHQTDFEQVDFERLAALAPILQRTVALAKRLDEIRLAEQANVAALETLQIAVLVLGDGAQILHANGPARRMLDRAMELRLLQGRLSLKHNQRDLYQRLATCAVDGGGIIILPRADGLPPLQLTVSPIPSEQRPLWSDRHPVALVTILDPAADLERRRSRLQHLYGLSPAEIALALEIAKGDGRAAAAARRGVSVTTARAQLSSIFSKTGTHRQAELARLIAQL